MIYLGSFKAADTVKYRANFHNDTGTLENPTSPEAQIEKPDASFTALTTPAIINSKTGHYGGSIDTTGFAVGQYIIRMAGTVATAKTVATEFCFTIVANIESDTYAIVSNGTYGNSALQTQGSAIKTKTDFLPSATAGTTGGVFIAGTNAATSVTTAFTANITGNLSGSIGSISGITFPTNFGVMSISATTGLVDITQVAADKVWSTTVRVLTAGTNIALAKGVGLTGLNDIAASDILTSALTESYAADGATFTLAQALYQIWSALGDFSISGTTITCKKLDGTTSSMSFTLDDSASPTSRTRAT